MAREGPAMKCAIMQPTYLPWAGYFNLISKADYFVFLDDAQFQKSSWHNRNKLLVNGIATWLTIPVSRNFLGQTLHDSQIDDQKPWRRKHLNLIELNYNNHPYFSEINSLLAIIKDTTLQQLASFDIQLITTICSLLKLNTQFVLTSELHAPGKRSERLVNICKELGCNEYISPPGASEYLAEDGFTTMSDIKLTINEFNPPPYSQLKTPNFISHLSIIDIIANIGPELTRRYILS